MAATFCEGRFHPEIEDTSYRTFLFETHFVFIQESTHMHIAQLGFPIAILLPEIARNF